MKRVLKGILNIIALALCVGCLFACGTPEQQSGSPSDRGVGDGSKPGSGFAMIAEVKKLGEKLEVDVIKADYTSGVHWVITPNETEYYDKDGNRIDRSDIKVGDIVEILFSGQVMMSYPPQIVAAKITVK